MTDRTVKGTRKTAKTTAPVDVPEADVAEQRRDAFAEDDDDTPPDDDQPFDADPADAAEQRIAVEFDDDEYR